MHNFLNWSTLWAYINVHNFNVTCLSETYLDSFNIHDDNLQIPGYNLYREDDPLNSKQGGVYIYYKIPLLLKVKNIHYLQECINFEIKIKDKLCNFITLYLSPINVKMIFESFISNFLLNFDSIIVNNPLVTVGLGDCNAKSNLWYNNDVTTYEGFKTDGVTF